MKINYALMLLGVIAFNHPFLSIFEKKYQFLFVPVVIVAVFIIWAVYIALLYLTYRKGGK